MQVKKFRAATTRAALEQIKKELGEDAFVLETRRVLTRGFLGLKTESQIEISAAAPASVAKNEKPKRADAPSKLYLKDDTIAAPIGQLKKTVAQKNLSRKTEATDEDVLDFFGTENLAPLSPKFEAVEISPDAPRLIHSKKEPAKQPVKPIIAAPNATTAAAPVEIAAPVVSARDLELLQAELREVKFSLGAFAARQNNLSAHALIDFDAQGEIYDSPFYESFVELTTTGIVPELARKLVQNVIPDVKAGKIEANEIARTALLRGLAARVKFAADPLRQNESAILAVIGGTGVGKTTTLAKLAARVALHENRRVELVTLDTYRIAAVEQLKTYAEIIGAGCHVVRSTLELDALLRRLQSEEATVLIDTTGRSPHDLADQFELCDYLQSRREIRKCLTVQATTNTLDGIAAVRKFEMYGADCLAITKMDETTRPGAMLELAAESALPLIYFGIGQRVPEDLQIAAPESFAGRIFGEKTIRTMTALSRN